MEEPDQTNPVQSWTGEFSSVLVTHEERQKVHYYSISVIGLRGSGHLHV